MFRPYPGKAYQALLTPHVGAAEAVRMRRTSPHGTLLGWHLRKRSSKSSHLLREHGSNSLREQNLGEDSSAPYRLGFPDGHHFQQDYDPKHTSRPAPVFMIQSGINWRKTPLESPDLHPIELIWHELKHFLCAIKKPSTVDELLSRITRFWQERVVAKKCVKYIEHLHL